jgi:hypothetical protein
VIGSETAVVRNAGTMLEQLAQRIGATIDPIVEAAIASCDQLESRCRQRGLGEAPPWDACLIGVDFSSTVDVNPRGEEGRARHVVKDSTGEMQMIDGCRLGARIARRRPVSWTEEAHP